MRELDVRGVSCPAPVVSVKRALEASEGDLQVQASMTSGIKTPDKSTWPGLATVRWLHLKKDLGLIA
jgi:copper chaperone CopZ